LKLFNFILLLIALTASFLFAQMNRHVTSQYPTIQEAVNASQTSSQTVFLSSPSNDALNIQTSPVFKWYNISETVGYCLQVATDSNFTNVIINNCSIKDSLYQLSIVPPKNWTKIWNNLR
jgi:hypothetical protein